MAGMELRSSVLGGSVSRREEGKVLGVGKRVLNSGELACLCYNAAASAFAAHPAEGFTSCPPSVIGPLGSGAIALP